MAWRELNISQARIAACCRRHGVRRLAVFGSAIRHDFTERSDIDLLVEYEPDARAGLSFFALQDELTAIIGRKVDLHTPGFLDQYYRDQVLQEAETIYVAQ
jgi:predicted nucleotidyltransferase